MGIFLFLRCHGEFASGVWYMCVCVFGNGLCGEEEFPTGDYCALPFTIWDFTILQSPPDCIGFVSLRRAAVLFLRWVFSVGFLFVRVVCCFLLAHVLLCIFHSSIACYFVVVVVCMPICVVSLCLLVSVGHLHGSICVSCI